MKIIVFDELVQVHAETLKSNQEVLSKQHIVLDPDDVVGIILVVVVEVLQQLEFDSGLVLKLLLVPDYLNRYFLLCLVVEAFDSLAKAALT